MHAIYPKFADGLIRRLTLKYPKTNSDFDEHIVWNVDKTIYLVMGLVAIWARRYSERGLWAVSRHQRKNE